MKKARKIIEKHSTGKTVLWLFITTNLVYAIMLLITIPKTMYFSNGMKLLDMMPMGYGSEYVNSLFETLGKTGRHVYLYAQLPVDMIYPFLFGVSYSLLIAYFLKKFDKLNSAFFYLCFLPVVAGIADYLENFGIITMLNDYPVLSKTVIEYTNIFSIIKSSATTVYFVALIIIILLFGIKTLNKRKAGAYTF